jgi:hypothetical protein
MCIWVSGYCLWWREFVILVSYGEENSEEEEPVGFYGRVY